MQARPLILAAAAYVAFAFPWAVVWHVALFRPLHETLGYFDESPSLALGFASVARGLKYALAAGAFLWTCHVLAAAAKQPSLLDWRYFLLETPYLAVQFGAYGLALAWPGQPAAAPAPGR